MSFIWINVQFQILDLELLMKQYTVFKPIVHPVVPEIAAKWKQMTFYHQ